MYIQLILLTSASFMPTDFFYVYFERDEESELRRDRERGERESHYDYEITINLEIRYIALTFSE